MDTCAREVYMQFDSIATPYQKRHYLIIAHINSTNLYNKFNDDRNQVSVVSKIKGLSALRCAESLTWTGAQADVSGQNIDLCEFVLWFISFSLWTQNTR